MTTAARQLESSFPEETPAIHPSANRMAELEDLRRYVGGDKVFVGRLALAMADGEVIDERGNTLGRLDDTSRFVRNATAEDELSN